MDTEQIKILLERYNQGKCSPEEAAIVDQWFENINRHQSTYVEEKELDRELDSIKMQLNQHIAPAPRVKPMRARYWYAAAAAAVLLAAGLFWFNQSGPAVNTPGNTVTTPLAANQSHRIVKDGFVEITTEKGHKENITLEDGSTFELNAGSKVRYPEHFGDSSRAVFLEEGEAFFTVAADPARRFVVNAGDLATTALGTSFNIRAYASEQKVIVALITGKVKIDQLNTRQQTTSLILLPSEQISYDRVSLHLVKTNFSKPDDITGWKQGYLLFRDAPYNEIVTGIENRYGVTVINNSDKKEWNYNGSFKNENLKDVMDIICLAKSLSYTIKNDTVYLQNKN